MGKKLSLMHRKIGDIFKTALPPDYELIRDEACGGTQRIPLFYVAEKSRKTEYCNVDLLVLKENKIKIIVEIEESNVKPTQICGKFLTSAFSKYYIHNSANNAPIVMDSSVTFIQIVDTSKLVKNRTSKFEQWKALEMSINNTKPLNYSNISCYRLLATEELSNLPFLIKEIIQ
jgi:translation elongation factor EF-Ts